MASTNLTQTKMANNTTGNSFKSTSLTPCGPVMWYGDIDLVNIVSGNGFLPTNVDSEIFLSIHVPLHRKYAKHASQNMMEK